MISTRAGGVTRVRPALRARGGTPRSRLPARLRASRPHALRLGPRLGQGEAIPDEHPCPASSGAGVRPGDRLISAGARGAVQRRQALRSGPVRQPRATVMARHSSGAVGGLSVALRAYAYSSTDRSTIPGRGRPTVFVVCSQHYYRVIAIMLN